MDQAALIEEDHSVLTQPAAVFIVSSDASTQYGGEAFIPVRYFQMLRRKGHLVRLVTHARNAEDLSAALGEDIEWVDCIDETCFDTALWAVGRRLPPRLSMVTIELLLRWICGMRQVQLILQRALERVVSLVHQPTPVSPIDVSPFHGLGVPVVIGPMNGSLDFPPGYDDLEIPLAKLTTRVARAVAIIANRVIPGKREAAVLLVANEQTRAALPVRVHPNVLDLVENGVDFQIWHGLEDHAAAQCRDGRFKLVFLGRLVDWKAVDITIEAIAMARAHGLDVVLEIIGDGWERDRLEALVADRCLGRAMIFTGYLLQDERALRLSSSDAMILNSVRECGGAVVLKGMAMGLPVIASDWGGPADYLDVTCGMLVSPVPRSTSTIRLIDAITELASDPEKCARLGRIGKLKAKNEYDRDAKADKAMVIFEAVMSDHENAALRRWLC